MVGIVVLVLTRFRGHFSSPCTSPLQSACSLFSLFSLLFLFSKKLSPSSRSLPSSPPLDHPRAFPQNPLYREQSDQQGQEGRQTTQLELGRARDVACNEPIGQAGS
jgi:hypothetical protein